MRKHRTVEDRFWSKVDIRSEDDCWPWVAGFHPAGYGMFRIFAGRSMWHSQRVAWFLANGPIPDGLHILHHCDNPACCNPRHLYAGTNADNMRDKVERGRSSYPHPWRQGEKHHNAKLTDDQVVEIREKLDGAKRGMGKALAEKYGVSRATITHIKKRKIWKHV